MSFSVLSNWINPSLLSKAEDYSKQFGKNKPFAHIVLHPFLREDKAKALKEALLKEKFIKKEADLFQFSQTQELKYSKNGVIQDFYQLVSSRAFAEFMTLLTGLKVKQGAIDLAGSLYESTDYLLCHDDQLEDRKIAYILYLNDDFKESDGGSFMLLDSIKGRASSVVQKHYPRWNSLMMFEVSPISFHAVEEVMSNKKRYAIGGWLH